MFFKQAFSGNYNIGAVAATAVQNVPRYIFCSPSLITNYDTCTQFSPLTLSSIRAGHTFIGRDSIISVRTPNRHKNRERAAALQFRDYYHTYKNEVVPITAHRDYEKITTMNKNKPPLALNFSLQVAKHLLQVNPAIHNNLACSPLSIDTIIRILAVGARGDMLGQLLKALECDDVQQVNDTAAEVAELFHGLNCEKGERPVLTSANALLVDQCNPLKAAFKEVLKKVHKTEAKVVDFQNQADQVVEEANLWADTQSHGLIKNILSRQSIKTDTMMILANALFFKGTWVKTFMPQATKDENFYLLNGEIVKAPFMKERASYFDYGTFEGCKVLRMLYREGETFVNEKLRSFSMYIFLPDENDGLPEIMKSINLDKNFFEEQIKLENKKIDNLVIPKFNFECDFSLDEPMKRLGLTLPFDRSCRELSDMVEDVTCNIWPYVTDIRQKSRIEIDEEGTKVAVFTTIHMGQGRARSLPPPPPRNFVADHPFMFMIREDFSDNIVFIGTVLNPLS